MKYVLLGDPLIAVVSYVFSTRLNLIASMHVGQLYVQILVRNTPLWTSTEQV